jgi:tRNA pseudouridine32 synthase/23S rRNA pseudouridine746 synthase
MKSHKLKAYFDSKDILVVEKPAGFLSVPSVMGKKDTRLVVGILAQNQWGPLFPVHRLDFEVAGLLVFAKNAQAHKILQQMWENKGVHKTYRALSLGQDFSHWPQNVPGADLNFELSNTSGIWTSRIEQGKRRSFIAEHGLESRTDFKLIAENSILKSWQLSPITGRRHQLRLEMSRHGFPIRGDSLYGGTKATHQEPQEIALVASELHFHKDLRIELPEHLVLDWNWNLWESRFAP